METDWGPRLERYRAYLTLLARMRLDGKARAKLSASDLVQQTLLEAFQRRGAFRGTGDGQLAALLRKALVNNLKDAVKGLRRGKRDLDRERPMDEAIRDSSAHLGALLAGKVPSPSSLVSADEQAARLARALEQLPEGQARAITLHHLRGHSLAEMAAELGKSELAAAGLLHRGLARLRELLKETD